MADQNQATQPNKIKAKPPAIYMIAIIMDAGRIVGARLVDINAARRKPTDVDINSCLLVVSSDPTAIKNIKYDPSTHQMNLINGSIYNLTKLNRKGQPLEYIPYNGRRLPKAPLVIINQIEMIGYTVADYTGEVRKMPTEKLIEQAKVLGLANGIIEYSQERNQEFITGMEEPYPILTVAKSKVGAVGGVANLRMAMPGRDNSTVARNVGIDVENQINYTDVFQCMSPQQKKCVQNYYMWYTVDMYRAIAKSTKFNLKVDKAEKLANLRGDQEWEFGGIVDTGCLGMSQCSLGHSLRYEYHAVVFDNQGNIINRIIFGETCSSDFFDISVEDMRQLVKVRKKMSQEIEVLTDAMANNKVDELWSGVDLLRKCVIKLDKTGTLKVFGDKVGGTLLNFIGYGLPFPESLVKLARKIAYRSVEVGKGNAALFWSEVFPEYKTDISRLYNDYAAVKQVNRYRNGILDSCYKYLEFCCYNKLDGQYAYDPIKETGKGEGGFNKNTRAERSYFLRSIMSTILCKEYSYEEIETFLKTIHQLYLNLDEIFYRDPEAKADPKEYQEYIRSYVNKINRDDEWNIEEKNSTIELMDGAFLSMALSPYINPYTQSSLAERSDRYSSWRSQRNNAVKSIDQILEKAEKADIETAVKMIVGSKIAQKIEQDAAEKERLEREKEAKDLEKKAPIIEWLRKEQPRLMELKIGQSSIKCCIKKEGARFEQIDDTLYCVAYRTQDNMIRFFTCGLNFWLGDFTSLISAISDADFIQMLKSDKIYKEDRTLEFVKFITNDLRTYEVVSETVDSIIDTESKLDIWLKENNKYVRDKTSVLRDYFTLNGYLVDGKIAKEIAYPDNIALSIVQRGISYNRLSYKQKYCIDQAYKKFCAPKDDTDGQDDDKKEAGQDDASDSLMSKVTFILTMTDESTELGAKVAAKVRERDPIAINICKTVKSTGRISDRQKKHIMDVYRMIKATKTW